MTIVDTCVWINHLRNPDVILSALLKTGTVHVHPFVLGELASGTLTKREATLTDLRELPTALVASEDEVHSLVESRRLWGLGLGWVDLHLLASALISKSNLLTDDQRLAAAARRLGIGCPLQ